MTDMYHIHSIDRYGRSKSALEDKETSNEIVYIDDVIKGMPLLQRSFFKTRYKTLLKKYENCPAIRMTNDYILEVSNCTYEKMLDFNKNPSWFKYFLTIRGTTQKRNIYKLAYLK